MHQGSRNVCSILSQLSQAEGRATPWTRSTLKVKKPFALNHKLRKKIQSSHFASCTHFWKELTHTQKRTCSELPTKRPQAWGLYLQHSCSDTRGMTTATTQQNKLQIHKNTSRSFLRLCPGLKIGI